jgi:hypothetical protein
MASTKDYLPQSVPPDQVRLWAGLSEMMSDSVSVVIDRADITVAANDTWEYVLPFRLIGSVSGSVIPYTGNVGAAVTLTTGSGPTPVVDDATPAVVMGHGQVTVSHGDTGYVATDVASTVITYTNLRGATVTDTHKVTFS